MSSFLGRVVQNAENPVDPLFYVDFKRTPLYNKSTKLSVFMLFIRGVFMNIKRLLSALMACAVVGAAAPAVTYNSPSALIAQALEEYTEGTYGVLTYKNYGDHIEISDCDESAAEVEIPAEIDGLPVTVIGDEAFYLRENLTSITIPDSVTKIGERAFSDCTSLTSITLPNSITVIGNWAFLTCFSLTSITLPDSITMIGEHAFDDCYNLTSITILNLNCEIADDEYTFSNFYDETRTSYFTGTIYGYAGSTAQAYAEKYGRNFVALTDSAETLGDIDADGVINALDASLVLTEYAAAATGQASILNDTARSNADINSDGAVDALDASEILCYYSYTATGGTLSFDEWIAS